MHFLIFLIEIFYVPLLAFLAKSNLTHFESAEQSEYAFNRSLNAIIFVINADISINGYELDMDMWHVGKSQIVFACNYVFYSSIILSKNFTITVKLFISSEPCQTLTLLLARLFPHNSHQGFTPFLSSSGRFLSCSSLVSSWSYRSAVLHDSELVCLAFTALLLNTASSLARLHPLLTEWEILSRAFTANHPTVMCSVDIHRQHF